MSTKQNEHPLHHSWVIWEHQRVIKPEDYKNSMRDACEFSTVEEFWRVWSYIPRPSEVLYENGRKEPFRKIDAFSVFKKGIRPQWEDPQNHMAAEWSTTSSFDYDIDILWENLVLSLIGQTIEEVDEICGCRVVDKSKRTKSPKPFYRLELWLRTGVKREQADKIKVRLLEALADGDSAAIPNLPAFEYKLRP